MNGPGGDAPAPVTDVHAHHVGAHVVERIEAEGAAHGVRMVRQDTAVRVEVAGRLSGLPLIPPLNDVPARLAWMDAAGVDVQLVAPWMDLAGYELDGPDGHWLSAAQNDALAALVAEHPDRFLAAAAVPLQEPGLAAAELRRAVGELGHRAVQIGARVGEAGLDDQGLDVFWDAAEDLDVPVIVHPAELDVPERSRRLFLHILVGNPAETTFAAAALMLGGILERHPRLRVLLVHGGGFVPYQIGRLDRGFSAAPPAFRARGELRPRALLDRLWFDSVLHDDDALRHLVDFADPGHVVLGSDYPFPMRVDRPVGALGGAGLDAGQRAAVLDPAGLLGPAAAGTGLSGPSRSTPSAPPRPAPGGRWTA
ncbi:aminocarboxymuconate-semialdehyde decarboxylase [Actinacidiphila yanglinensis]|uniref:Aminocarboxymuconate-semialdehyde decarboxylase n=1 Tax=Actinacidiphila yanglinensis TaxID=310779 RepID=A0A1H6EH31_9ACTN|nr:amidohydrolase family protein [Actinacidiphila yanglinensis]SEG96125.1 aminocarboxymuconate-semialdehyde decarboxylase [Actinacidiphila yanglinensis]